MIIAKLRTLLKTTAFVGLVSFGWGSGFAYAADLPSAPENLEAVKSGEPIFSWDALDSATYYQLWVQDTTGIVSQRWFKVGSYPTLSCTNPFPGPSRCSIRPGIDLELGLVRWWVRGWNAEPAGEWSSEQTFTLDNFTVPAVSVVPVSNSESNPAGNGTTVRTVSVRCPSRSVVAGGDCQVQEFNSNHSQLDWVIQSGKTSVPAEYQCEFRCEPTLSGKSSTASCTTSVVLSVSAQCLTGVQLGGGSLGADF